MDDSSKLIRFLYIGTVEANYMSKQKPLSVEQIKAQLEFIKNAVKIPTADATPILPTTSSTAASSSHVFDPLWPLNIIKRVNKTIEKQCIL